MSWKDTSVSVSRIDAIWDKEDVFTCLNGQTGHDLGPIQTCLRVSMDRLATTWDQDRRVYVSQWTDWPRNCCQTGHRRGARSDSH